jgi:hypothetical protein
VALVCSVAQLGCSVAQTGCSVAHMVVSLLALRQARVRISALHGGFAHCADSYEDTYGDGPQRMFMNELHVCKNVSIV